MENMPLFYITSEPGKIATRIVDLPLSRPSGRAMHRALVHAIGVPVQELTRIEVPDARDGHGAFYFWQARAAGALLTVIPIRSVKHLIEHGLAQRLPAGRSSGRSSGYSPGDPVEVLKVWASGGAQKKGDPGEARSGKNSRAWFSGYEYVGERGPHLVVRHTRGAFMGNVVNVPPKDVRRQGSGEGAGPRAASW